MRAAALVLLLAGPAAAQDYVETAPGALSDKDFYRLVACGAPPGEACREPLVRWPEPEGLTVALEPIAPSYPKRLAKVMVEALDLAVAEINRAGARLALRRLPFGERGAIRVFLTPAGDGERIWGTGLSEIDGEPIGAGLTTVWWDGRRQIYEAVIVMAGDLPEREVLPVMLEELTQSLGLLTDIRNPWYQSRSVFAEDSNSVRQLGPQDVMALRRHYP